MSCHPRLGQDAAVAILGVPFEAGERDTTVRQALLEECAAQARHHVPIVQSGIQGAERGSGRAFAPSTGSDASRLHSSNDPSYIRTSRPSTRSARYIHEPCTPMWQ